MHEDRAMLNFYVRHSEDGGVADEDVLGACGGGEREQAHHCPEANQHRQECLCHISLASCTSPPCGRINVAQTLLSVLRSVGTSVSDHRQPSTEHFFNHFLLPVKGNVPSVVDTVPSMFEPCSVPWKTPSPSSSLPRPAIENSTVVPSTVPFPMLPAPRSPENVPLIWPFSTCSVAEMFASPAVVLTTKLQLPSSA